jgi:DNA adenine methylase
MMETVPKLQVFETGSTHFPSQGRGIKPHLRMNVDKCRLTLGNGRIYIMSDTCLAIKKKGTSPVYIDGESSFETSNIRISVRRRKKIAFGWYGGKFSHLDWLLPLLPACPCYCEPFAGSAAVLLNRCPASVETYNDIDGEVVNFFRTLRDNADELIRVISLTPFSREEYFTAVYGDTENVSAVERARRFYIRARQTRTGLAQTASLGRWANCKNTSRSGMSGAVSRWLGGVDDLDVIAKRLLRVQIENRPAIDVITLYDAPETLFYCDPPYLHETRGDSNAYAYEMDEAQHREFAEVINNCRGFAAVSGYDHPIMDKLFEKRKWIKSHEEAKPIHSTKNIRQEVLWTNYNPKTMKKLTV